MDALTDFHIFVLLLFFSKITVFDAGLRQKMSDYFSKMLKYKSAKPIIVVSVWGPAYTPADIKVNNVVMKSAILVFLC